MPLEEVEGILPGARVYARATSESGLHSGKQLPLGPALLGRVLDGSGRGTRQPSGTGKTTTLGVGAAPFNPLQRTPIEHVLDVGVRPINALLTVGRGQRYGPVCRFWRGKKCAVGHDGTLYPGRCNRRGVNRRTWA